MPGRRLPPHLAAHLGECKKPSTPAEEVVEQCGFAKLLGDAGLTDHVPLVVVMNLVAAEVAGLGLSLKAPDNGEEYPDGFGVWIEAMELLQKDDDEILGHNTFFPCRWCDTAYEPVIEEELLITLAAWMISRDPLFLLDLHKCPDCGGEYQAVRTKKYEGDLHTPEPGSVPEGKKGDRHWVKRLLRHTPLA